MSVTPTSRSEGRTFWRSLQHGRGEQATGAVLLAYSFVRVGIATAAFKEYGLNPFVFAAVEVSTAYPYGVVLARTLRRLSVGEFRLAVAPGLTAALLIAAPYLYVVAATTGVPPLPMFGLRAVFGLAVLTFLLGLVKTWKRSRSRTGAHR